MHFISFTIKLSILLLLLLCVFAIPISKFSLNNYTDYTSIFLTMCTNRLQVVFFLVASGDDPTNNNIPTHLWLQEILNVSTFRGFCRCYLIWWTPWWRRWLPWVTWQTWTIYFKNHFPCFFPTKNTPWIFQQKKNTVHRSETSRKDGDLPGREMGCPIVDLSQTLDPSCEVWGWNVGGSVNSKSEWHQNLPLILGGLVVGIHVIYTLYDIKDI